MIKIYNLIAFLLIMPKLLLGAGDDWDRYPERHPAAGSGPYVDVRDYQVFYEQSLPREYPIQTRDMIPGLKSDIHRWPVVSREMFYVLCGLKPSEFGLVQRLRSTSPELFKKPVRHFVQNLQANEHNLLEFLTWIGSPDLLKYLAFQCVMPTGTVVLEEDTKYVAPPPALGREGMDPSDIAKDYAGTSLVERRYFERRHRRLGLGGLTFEGNPLSIYFRLLMKAEYNRIQEAKQGYQDLSKRLSEEKNKKAKIMGKDRNIGTSVAVLIGSQIDEDGDEIRVILSIPSRPVFASGAVFLDVPGTEVTASRDSLAYLTAPEFPYPVCSLGSFAPEEAMDAAAEARRDMAGAVGVSSPRKAACKSSRPMGCAAAASTPRLRSSGAAGSDDSSLSTIDAAAPEAMSGAGGDSHVHSPAISIASLLEEEPEVSAIEHFRSVEARLYAESGGVAHSHSPGAADSYYASRGGVGKFDELAGRGHVRFHSHSEQSAAWYYRKVMIPQIQEMLANNPSFRLKKILLGVFTDRDPCPICASRIQHECAAFKIRHLSGGGVVEEHRLAGIITGYRDFSDQVLTGGDAPEFAYRKSRDPRTAAGPQAIDLSDPEAFALMTGTETGDPA